MFRLSTIGAFSPESKRIWFQFRSHQLDDFSRIEAKLFADSIERRSIFPSHLDDAVDLSRVELANLSRYFHILRTAGFNGDLTVDGQSLVNCESADGQARD